MLKKILAALVLVVVLLVVGGFVLPTEYSLAREITIDAPPDKVHAYVGDLEKWEQWTPWQDNDPTVEVTFGDKTTGVGASQSWTSQDGPGSLEFTMCDPATGIAYDMKFGETPAKSAMTYEFVDGKTKVTWSMEGDMAVPVLGPYLRMMMPGMVGDSFDQGLEKLKSKVEQN